MRAALLALPVAMMITTGVAAAAAIPAVQTGPGTTAAKSGKLADSTVELRVKRHARAGGAVSARGRARPGGRRWVTIRMGAKTVMTVRTKPNGRFRARWRAGGAGVHEVKAIARGNGKAKRARSRAQRVNVYRAAHASYYGPGLYGNGTACGRTLTPSTLGVANKSLPCGTKVTFRYRGRSVRVPVIDRGPYAGNREWDLTAATKAKLRFGSTGVVLSTR